MNAKHTPGPWKCGAGPWKCGADEPFVYALNAHGSNRFFSGVQAGWLAGEPVEGRTAPEELLANAKLMSAAPELLEALEGFLAEFGDKAVNANVQKARAAIKKARGETV